MQPQNKYTVVYIVNSLLNNALKSAIFRHAVREKRATIVVLPGVQSWTYLVVYVEQLATTKLKEQQKCPGKTKFLVLMAVFEADTTTFVLLMNVQILQGCILYCYILFLMQTSFSS